MTYSIHFPLDFSYQNHTSIVWVIVYNSLKEIKKTSMSMFSIAYSIHFFYKLPLNITPKYSTAYYTYLY